LGCYIRIYIEIHESTIDASLDDFKQKSKVNLHLAFLTLHLLFGELLMSIILELYVKLTFWNLMVILSLNMLFSWWFVSCMKSACVLIACSFNDLFVTIT